MNTVNGKTLQNDRYTLIEELGQGGFGVTYKATDHNLGQIVVIKTLNQSLRKDPNFEKFYKQFHDEARRLASCIHPNIVKINDFFTENDIPYIVMDYIPGKTLQSIVLPNNPLSEDLALKYIYQIAQAVQEIHNQGLLHRDIKPNNIILKDGTEEVILIDFGIAREFQPGATQNHTGIVSEGYAPIEQYLETEKRTPATDIYALSATLYVLLTAKIPTPASLRDRQKLADPIHIRPKLSQKVNDGIMRGLEMEMSDRPETVDKWLELLPKINELTEIKSKGKQKSLTTLSPKSSEKSREKINYFESGLVISTMIASFVAISAVIAMAIVTFNKPKPSLITENNQTKEISKNKVTENVEDKDIQPTNKTVINSSTEGDKGENIDKSEEKTTENKIPQIPEKQDENVKKQESDEEEKPVIKTEKSKVTQQVERENKKDDNNSDSQGKNPGNDNVRQREETPVVKTEKIEEKKISRKKRKSDDVASVSTNREIQKTKTGNSDNQVKNRTVKSKKETGNSEKNNQTATVTPKTTTPVSSNNQQKIKQKSGVEKNVGVNPPFSHVNKKRETDNANITPPNPPIQRKQDTIEANPQSQSSGERGN